MATLTVTATEDYRDGSPPIPASTTAIVFSTSGFAEARFNSSQFGGSGISSTVAITGDGNINAIIVHTPSDAFFSAASWTFSSWSANDRVQFFGTSDAETITGSSQSNTFVGGDGADFLTGGALADNFVYSIASHVETGEIINGNGGTDKITVSTNGVDLSLAIIASIEQLAIFGSATLDDSQIGAGKINEVIGNVAQSAALTVNGNAVNLTAVTFTDWNVAIHSIAINGTSGADTLIGSSQNDTIKGGLGADTTSGGDGDDTFVYDASTDFVAGETIDGGAGTGDTLRVNVGQGFGLDVSGAGVLSNVEKVVFDSAGTLTLAGENLGTGAGLVNQITGSAGINTLQLFDSAIDLTGVTFSNWTPGQDVIFLNGTAGNDIIIGSNLSDQFSLQPGGVDSVSGGAGDDFFSVNFEAFAAGATINGGAGTDEISTSGADFSNGTVVGIERLTFFDLFIGTTVDITVSSTQVRAGAIALVDGGNFIDTLTVKGASVDLTGVTFTQWTTGTDKVVITGVNGVNNVLTGSNQRDTINGGNLNDTITGGAGIDVLKGGLGNDTYVLGAETGDTITDTGGIDTVTSTISRSLASFASVDNLILLGSASNGTGNALGNNIRGNASTNVLRGEGGADVLTGDLGTDRMNGGTGADIFNFLTLGDTSKRKKLMDVIEDFSAEDTIDLSAIDAKKGGKDNRFKFIGKKDFSDKKGELHYAKKKGDIIVSGDVNGDGKADFAILIEDAKKAVKADFEL
ncbi:MAG: calcium-binding protein [Bauldia sp.]|nr:calcium-binding protein [Bauldia sp.]